MDHFTVEPGEAEAAQLVEQAARVHVAGDRTRKRLEAWRRALARQRTRLAFRVLQRRIGQPAREHARRRRRLGLNRRRVDLGQASDFAPVQSGHGADAAHNPITDGKAVRLAGGGNKRCLQHFLHRCVQHALTHCELRQRLQQFAHGVEQCRRVHGRGNARLFRRGGPSGGVGCTRGGEG
jgi:hypothetical protein